MQITDPFQPGGGKKSSKAATKPAVKAPEPVSPVPSGSVKEVLAWVGDDPKKAQLVLDAEKKSDSPRKGLVAEARKISG